MRRMLKKAIGKTFMTFLCCLTIAGSVYAAPAPAPDVAVVSLPRSEHEPVIDGRIEAEEWGKAAALTGVIGIGQKLATRQTVFFLQWRPDALLLAIRGYFEPGVFPVKRDSAALCDCLELGVFAPDVSNNEAILCHPFVFPDGSPVHMESYLPFTHEFIRANLPSGRLIQNASRIEEDPDRTYGVGTRRWEAEIRVPLDMLQRNQPFHAGETISLLLCRNYGTKWEQTHIPVARGFFDPTGFIQARLVETAPVARLTDVRPLVTGTGTFALSIGHAASKSAAVQVSYSFATDLAASTVVVTLPAGGERAVELPKPGVNQGVFDLDIADADSNRIFHLRTPFETRTSAPQGGEAGVPASPQAEHLVYAANEGLFLLQCQPAGFLDTTRLTYRQGSGSAPRLSPVGASVLLTSEEGGKSGIWLLEDFGRRQRRLVDGRDATWLPDGSGMVYEREGRLYRLSLAPGVGKSQDITPRKFSACRYPVVSGKTPSRLAFVVDGRTLFQSTPEGKGAKPLAKGELSGPPAWSPDGKWLAFQDGPHLWMVDGSGNRRLAVGGVGIKSCPSWEVEGRAIAACFTPFVGGPTEWRAFALGATDVASGTLVLPRVFSGVDGVWRFENSPAAVVNPYLMAPPTSRSVILGRTPAGEISLIGEAVVMEKRVERRLTGYRISGLDRRSTLTIAGPLTQLIMVDRLGRDLAVTPRDAVVMLDFAPLLICPAAGGAGVLVVANPTGTAAVEAQWRNNRWTLSLGNSKSTVAVGFAAGGDGSLWHDPAAGSVGSVQGVTGQWRFVGGEGMASVSFAGVPGANTNETRCSYLFARTAQSPLRGLSVTDIVQDLCGLSGGENEALLQENACLKFRVAGQRTIYPTMGLCFDSIVQASRPDQLHFMSQDIPGWCEDAEAILQGMDQRLDEYAEAAGRLELTELTGLLAARSGFVTPAALKAMRTELLVDGKLNAKNYLESGRKTAGEREKLLGQCHEQVVALRMASGLDCLNATDAKMRAAVVERWTGYGKLLANRHVAEGQWLGEPVALPYMTPFWQDNMWGY